jgi:ribosomal protein S3
VVFAQEGIRDLLAEDRKIREILKKKLESASVPKILIERAASRCRITILTARPGRGHRPQGRGN